MQVWHSWLEFDIQNLLAIYMILKNTFISIYPPRERWVFETLRTSSLNSVRKRPKDEMLKKINTSQNQAASARWTRGSQASCYFAALPSAWPLHWHRALLAVLAKLHLHWSVPPDTKGLQDAKDRSIET